MPLCLIKINKRTICHFISTVYRNIGLEIPLFCSGMRFGLREEKLIIQIKNKFYDTRKKKLQQLEQFIR